MSITNPIALQLYTSVKGGNGFIRDVTRNLWPTWRSSSRRIGGYWIATADYYGSREEQLEMFTAGLTREIRQMYSGLMTWQGLITEMHLTLGGATWKRSIFDVFNRVTMVHQIEYANLLTNGGGESGVWTGYNSPTTVEQSTSWFSEGTQSIHIVAGAASKGAYLQQGISISSLTAYSLSLSIKNISGTWLLAIVRSGTNTALGETQTDVVGENVLTCSISDHNDYSGTVDIRIETIGGTGEIYCDAGLFRKSSNYSLTKFYEDTASQAEYGRIDTALLRGVMNTDAAANEAQTYLKRHAWPRSLPPPSISVSGQEGLSITFCGYWATLNFRHALVVGTNTKSAHVTALVGESEFITAGTISTNSTNFAVEQTAPVRVGDTLSDIAEAGDASGSAWSIGVWNDRVLDYGQVVNELSYIYRRGKIFYSDGSEVPPWMLRPGFVRLDDDPTAYGFPSAIDEDDPRWLYADEIEFIAPDQFSIKSIKADVQIYLERREIPLALRAATLAGAKTQTFIGGGGGGNSLHSVLSSTHADTTAASPMRGDVITGQGASPLWTRLAISVPAANVRNVFGADNGDTEPAWKTALDATSPTTIAVGAAASPGTSLIFSHRDHVHGAPSTWTASAHNLLSAIHGDTTAASPVRGDVVTAQGVSPLWTRLAISVPAANVRNVLGVDNGDTESAWKTALDSTNPTTIAAAAAAAPGTSLIFAHRDHTHGAPATWPATAHNLLSASHGDTATGSVVDGDVVIGNVTPAWSRLAISVPAANVRNVLGIDNGEVRPSWKTALDATNPTTIAVGAAAAPGTSLVFSHRDHTHGAPTTWIATAHNLLSATHGDTAAGSVVDGDVIIGNVTPAWSRLVISVPAANVRNVLGVDNGETRPSWKTALDATNPVTLTVSTVAAPGTALVFSHRDHAHAITSSANPGATAAILATDASGHLQLLRLGIEQAPLAAVGIFVNPSTSGAAIYGISSQIRANANSTNAYAVAASVDVAASVAVTNAYGLLVTNPTVGAGGSIGTAYGLFINTISTGSANYAIYTNAGLVRFGGAVDATVSLAVAGGTAYTSISASPGAAAAILASTSAGYLQLVRVGAGVAPTVPLHAGGVTQDAIQSVIIGQAINASAQTKQFIIRIRADNASPLVLFRTDASAGTDPTMGFAIGTDTPALSISPGGGVTIGAPTGGSKGAGTINAAADIYKNDSAYNNPDFVLEQWATGRIEKYAGRPRAEGYQRMSLIDLESYIREHWRLPGIGDDPAGIFDMADIALEKIEELTTHLIEMGHRIERLEETV